MRCSIAMAALRLLELTDSLGSFAGLNIDDLQCVVAEC
jgi:hypothetical protein